MSKLNLFNSFVNSYNASELLVNVHYGTDEKPENEKGESIYGDSREAAFKTHLMEKITPHINHFFVKSDYQVKNEIEYPNNSDNPHLIIRRNNNNDLNNTDIKTIRDVMQQAVNSFNVTQEQKNKKNRSVMFAAPHDQNDAPEKSTTKKYAKAKTSRGIPAETQSRVPTHPHNTRFGKH
ncbi:MAG: hypothetical protein ACD_46C00624G0001 [uncultured bacterium]|nr:MAG: hypothetical protein ACD_46C00624G0001 [uncultured bacterium]